jgi:hypothetical protein
MKGRIHITKMKMQSSNNMTEIEDKGLGLVQVPSGKDVNGAGGNVEFSHQLA